MKTDYLAIVFGRNGNSSIRKVLDSLLAQTILPAKINIIDDGSTDGMRETILEYEQKYPQLIHAQETYSTESDWSRLPMIWNMGMERQYSYHLILPSDASLVPDYAERLLKAFDAQPSLVIASGDWGYKQSIAPHGGGRFVKQEFFNLYYPNGYPRILGYESEILERAILKGYTLCVLNDVEMFHHDPLGHSHNFREFGYGMRCLGYYPPYAFSRILWDFFNNPSVGKEGAVKILYYYLTFRPQKTGYYSKFPLDLRIAVSERQKKILLGTIMYRLFGKAISLAQRAGLKNTGVVRLIQRGRDRWKK